MSNIVPRAPQSALAVHADTDRYKCRFDIASQSSDAVYRCSFDTAIAAWVCSCPGYLSRKGGQCKHLTANNLKGRRYGRDERTLALFNGGGDRRLAIPAISDLDKLVGPIKKVKELPLSEETASVVRSVIGVKRKVRNALPAPIEDVVELE